MTSKNVRGCGSKFGTSLHHVPNFWPMVRMFLFKNLTISKNNIIPINKTKKEPIG
jgi:hypothetical protein